MADDKKHRKKTQSRSRSRSKTASKSRSRRAESDVAKELRKIVIGDAVTVHLADGSQLESTLRSVSSNQLAMIIEPESQEQSKLHDTRRVYLDYGSLTAVPGRVQRSEKGLTRILLSDGLDQQDRLFFVDNPLGVLAPCRAYRFGWFYGYRIPREFELKVHRLSVERVRVSGVTGGSLEPMDLVHFRLPFSSTDILEVFGRVASIRNLSSEEQAFECRFSSMNRATKRRLFYLLSRIQIFQESLQREDEPE